MLLQTSPDGSGPVFDGRVVKAAPNPALDGKVPAPLAILIVDDEPLIRWSLRRGLNRRGHTVVEAGSAAEALRCLAQSQPFDVVVLDYRLPDRHDLTLLAAVRDVSPNAVVLMMTAFGEEEMRRNAVALGARGVIDKPFQVSDVIARIEAR